MKLKLKKELMTACLCLFLSAGLCILLSCRSSLPVNAVTIPITIIHPGDPKSEPLDLELVQILDESGNPKGYSLWVDSVICRDKKCAVVKVNLFWDELGRYQRYLVEDGEDLTKLDHVPFTKKDHDKLQKILKDKESPLREVTKEGLTGPKSQGVDGVSGATVLTLGSNVVLGAGYTCYDLWHWSNGEVTELIRSKTAERCSDENLQEYLKSGETASIAFALHQLQKRKIRKPDIVKTVIMAMKDCDDDLVKPALDYIKTTGDWEVSAAEIFKTCNAKKRVFIIDNLIKNEKNITEKYLTGLSFGLTRFDSYHEVHRFLTLLETRKVWNETVAQNTAVLLNHKKFFFSRRAYWFLEKQKLEGEIKKKVEAFYDKYSERL